MYGTGIYGTIVYGAIFNAKTLVFVFIDDVAIGNDEIVGIVNEFVLTDSGVGADQDSLINMLVVIDSGTGADIIRIIGNSFELVGRVSGDNELYGKIVELRNSGKVKNIDIIGKISK
jgi:hypothetical protein